MSAASIGIEGALAALDGAANGKALRAWMEQHREAVLAHQDGRRIDWRALCDWFASAGLLNGKGQTPTIRCAQLTWYRVGKWLERRHARAASREAEALQREAEREALLATARQEAQQKQQDKERERQRLHERMAEADRGLATRQLEQARARSASVLFPEPAHAANQVHDTANRTTSSVPVISERAEHLPSPNEEKRVQIGQVAHTVRMREQAPRYGRDRDIPLPPPYTGPRPDGMPEDLPLDALMPLSASGMDENGLYDFKQMPGLPRRSFYDNERIWAVDCMAMIKAVPAIERPPALKAMMGWLEMLLGPSYKG